MDVTAQRKYALRTTLIGLMGLAVAMGIGRFAFTPMLPLMQSHNLMSLSQGSYLASANYVGYLLGALLCFALTPRPLDALRYGVVVVAISTLVVASASLMPIWLAMQLIAGTASAFVLIGVSAWALPILADSQRSNWSGWIFAGVGIGIMFAGLAVLAISAIGLVPSYGWLLLGLAATLAALFVPWFVGDVNVSPIALPLSAQGPLDRDAWRLIFCYGAFGYGYIIPATFLPATSRALVDNPAVFGWTWPVFGLAAATSTVITSAILGHVAPRRVWAAAQLVMAVGVALPAIQATFLTMIVSAVCVGGTFMVITMTGMREARRFAGPSATRLMAAMTAAFAVGQLAGSLTVSAVGSAVESIRGPSLLAAVVLLITALALVPGSRKLLSSTRRST